MTRNCRLQIGYFGTFRMEGQFHSGRRFICNIAKLFIQDLDLSWRQKQLQSQSQLSHMVLRGCQPQLWFQLQAQQNQKLTLVYA